jgi:hypothetical protein
VAENSEEASEDVSWLTGLRLPPDGNSLSCFAEETLHLSTCMLAETLRVLLCEDGGCFGCEVRDGVGRWPKGCGRNGGSYRWPG